MRMREKLPDDTSKGFASYFQALTSFLAGVARLFDFWGLFNSYNTTPNGRVTDAKALYSDWRAVGSDIDRAISSYSRTEILRK